MPLNPHFHAPILPERNFHICNRTNNRELLFLTEENKRFFIQQFDIYTNHILQPFGWSLLPNHFHLQVKAKPVKEVMNRIIQLPEEKRTPTQNRFLLGEVTYDHLASKELKRFFQSYAMSLNNQFRRQGNLFYKRFRCVEIEDYNQFRNTMVYIHTNPVKHGLIADFTEYQWSSWHEFNHRGPSIIDRAEVYKIFGNKTAFLTAHQVHQEHLLEKWKLGF